jgi:bacillithiol biosynthesis deacetylase BshB1
VTSQSTDILIVASHPDDAEIAMGGTIAALISQGATVAVLDLTNGEPTPFGTPERRATETKRASEILGVQRRILLDIKNREIFDTVENRMKVAEVIRELRPNILFGPYWEDAHPDHLEACKLVEGARFYAKFSKSSMKYEPFYPKKLFHYFSTHIRVRFQPSFIFDISGHIEQKMESLKAYASQFSENPKNAHVIESIRTQNGFWGSQIGANFGEPFVCRETLAVSMKSSLFDIATVE